jgi:hypothetical protein
MTVTVRAPLPSGLPSKKWGSPDIFANVAVLAIAVSAPAFPHQNLEGAPPARVRQLAEFIAPNLAVRTGAIAPARNIYDALAPRRWPEQFLFPSMARLPTAVPLRPALFDLPRKLGPYADYVPPNLAILSIAAPAPPPSGFRDFVGPVPKRWTESLLVSSSWMPPATPAGPYDYASSPRKRWQDSQSAGSTFMPTAAPTISAPYDGIARKGLAPDFIAPNLVALSGVLPLAPPVIFDYSVLPRRRWIDSPLPPNVAITATTILQAAPQALADYPGLPRKRLIESRPMGSTFMPLAPPTSPFQFERLPVKRWRIDERPPQMAAFFSIGLPFQTPRIIVKPEDLRALKVDADRTLKPEANRKIKLS